MATDKNREVVNCNEFIYYNYLRRHIHDLINNINDDLMNFLDNLYNDIQAQLRLDRGRIDGDERDALCQFF